MGFICTHSGMAIVGRILFHIHASVLPFRIHASVLPFRIHSSLFPWMVLLLAGFFLQVVAQEEEPDFNHILELFVPDDLEEGELQVLLENLQGLYRRPVDLNEAGYAELAQLPFLSTEDIDRILSYREITGPYLSVYELFLIEGMDSALVEILRPFLRISYVQHRRDTLPILHNLLRTSRRSFMIRYGRILQDQAGYSNNNGNMQSSSGLPAGNSYAGGPGHIYGRLEISQVDDFSIGLTFEKDAGEAFFFQRSLRTYGFDHYAGYFQLQERGILKELTVGDYQLHFGQGLVLGRGFFFKGSETTGAIRNSYTGCHPYQGAGETGFFRGVCVTLGSKNTSASVFCSVRRLDATFREDDQFRGSNTGYAVSLPESGYHRTPGELLGKSRLTEYSTGFNIQQIIANQMLTVGSAFVYHHWDTPLKLLPGYPNPFHFSGHNSISGSIYYSLYKGKFNLFGEVARDFGTGKTFIGGINQGLIAHLSPGLEFALMFRYFHPGYFSKYGKSFVEYSGNNNEEGIYWGVKIIPLKYLTIKAYYDIFRSRWLRYQIAAPAGGNEVFIKLNYRFSSAMDVNASFKRTCKSRNVTSGKSPAYAVEDGIHRRLRLEINLSPMDVLQLKTRMQGIAYRHGDYRSKGYSIAQDLIMKTGRIGLTFRLAYFNTEDYFSRQYIYEHDVLYAFRVPAYAGNGIRSYLLIKYSPYRRVDLWLKAGHYQYFDRREIGSGPAAIQGNKKTEIRCQVRIKF